MTSGAMRKSEACSLENTAWAQAIEPRDFAMPTTAAVPATRNP